MPLRKRESNNSQGKVSSKQSAANGPTVQQRYHWCLLTINTGAVQFAGLAPRLSQAAPYADAKAWTSQPRLA